MYIEFLRLVLHRGISWQYIRAFKHDYVVENPGKKILWAAENNNIEAVKEILTQDSSLVGSRDNDGYTALQRASYNGHTDMVLV